MFPVSKEGKKGESISSKRDQTASAFLYSQTWIPRGDITPTQLEKRKLYQEEGKTLKVLRKQHSNRLLIKLVQRSILAVRT